MQDLSYIIAMLGTAAFSISTVLSLRYDDVDIFAVLVFGTVSAVGGGTLRDIIMGQPVFWAHSMEYLMVAAVSSIIAFLIHSLLDKSYLYKTILYVDALAVAMFAVQATYKAWSLNFGLPVAPIWMGVITAIGGGVIRDTLLQKKSLLLSKELYAMPVMLGCMIFAITLVYLPEMVTLSALLSIALIFFMRILIIELKWQVPKWAMLRH
jgi:uncharacterized membrane protein YeiH